MVSHNASGPGGIAVPRSPAQQEEPVDKVSVPSGTVPDHERIRLDATGHPERTPSEHEDAARRIAARSYIEDMRRVQRRELVEEEM